MRTRAQRRWIRKGYTHEMIPPRPWNGAKGRVSYLLSRQDSWRAERKFGILIGIPVRPISKQMIHNGGKP